MVSSPKVIKLLLSHGVSVNAPDNHNGDGDPPIAWAAEKGIPDVFEYMLSRGADIRAINNSGATLLHTVFLRGDKYIERHAEVVRIMLNHNFDMLAHTDHRRDAALHLAARCGSLEAVKLMLDEHLPQRLDVNMRGSENSTPLYQASECSQPEMVEYLISKGADVNIPNSSEFTPLHIAAGSGRLDIVRALVSAGANVNAIRTPFITVLYDAVFSKHVDVAELLLEHGADVNGYLPPTDRKTHLHIAAWDPATLKVLLKYGANVNAKDSTGSTALMYAASHRENPQMCEILLEHGADVRARDNEGRKAWNRAHETGTNATKEVLERYMDIWPVKTGNSASDIEEEFIGSPTASWELENFFVIEEVDAQLAAAAQAQQEGSGQDAVEEVEDADGPTQNATEAEGEDINL
ncbi:ankyrin repeat-containing domain protein [Tuber brumale]|nr:ankyrin repeat-containing domain protein [Tuber brumale]